jgi:diguanylate cyclase (GGDEF)-like protein/PAS domain S-box-containing protein
MINCSLRRFSITIFRYFCDCYDLRLAALALGICFLATLAATFPLARAQVRDRRRGLWLLLTGIQFGGGVWSFDFVAMMAFLPTAKCTYDIADTALAIGVACAGSTLGFGLFVSGQRRMVRVAAATLVLTATVAAMQQLGIAAMRPHGVVDVRSLPLVPVYLLTAGLIGAGLLSLERVDRAGSRLRAATSLMLAVFSLHILSLVVATIVPVVGPMPEGGIVGSDMMGVTIGAVSLALLAINLAVSVADQLNFDRYRAEMNRIHQLASAMLDGLLIVRGGIILDVNDSLCTMLGYTPQQLIGQNLDRVLPPAAPGSATVRLADMRPETELLSATETLVPVELLVRDIEYNGAPAHTVTVRNLTQRRRHEATMAMLAYQDSLTGLPNRRMFMERLEAAIQRSDGTGEPFMVAYLDLDRFKLVNDLFGHSIGDRLLTDVGARVQPALQGSDVLARVGGDEFAMILAAGEPDGSCAGPIGRITAALAAPFIIEREHATTLEIDVTASVGIARYPVHGDTGESLLRCADIALYRVKAAGGGGCKVFEPAMDTELKHRVQLEYDLRHAVERDQLVLFYQPQVDCHTRVLQGFEALLRWNHPVLGLLSPALFIPLAEETGLIVPLSRWVLETACREAATWPGALRVAVNVSPLQFRQAGLPGQVGAILAASGLDGERLELEVTENVLMDGEQHAIDTILALKAQNIRIALDDFGTGYSSLAYLQRFPFDTIKIDKSFVVDLGNDPQADAIVDAIIMLAQSLNRAVVAEGVETELQLQSLQGFGCNQVQGYLLGRPAPVPALPGSTSEKEAALQPG